MARQPVIGPASVRKELPALGFQERRTRRKETNMAPQDDSDEYTADEIGETTEERAVWRFDQFLRTGYPELLASMLASDRRVDLELARRLVARLACPPELAARILL